MNNVKKFCPAIYYYIMLAKLVCCFFLSTFVLFIENKNFKGFLQ